MSTKNKITYITTNPLLIFSVFYVSDGNKQARKRKDEKSVIKRYCGAMVWFDRRQKKMCEKFPTLIEIVKTAVDKALEQCRAQFKWYRWNCSPLTWNQVFAEDGILKRRKCFTVRGDSTIIFSSDVDFKQPNTVYIDRDRGK